MQQLFLTEQEVAGNLFPFTLTRSVIDIRVGILTLREKWEAYLGQPVNMADNVMVPENASILSANILPSREFVNSMFRKGKLSDELAWNTVRIVQHPWHIFMWNDWAIRQDFALVTQKRKSAILPSNVIVSGSERIFIEPGARISHCMINAEAGPVYIGKDTVIMEGAMIRGPFALCEGSVVKMGARIYGATTIGPFCVVGGEIKNSVIFGYSNKAHDGYLGDSVIGEWCNIGAGTSNSNIKNNARDIKMWSRARNELITSGISKCGLIMGDYSRAAINTSFNTGTIVGVSSNVFGEGLTPKYIPDFSWGTSGVLKYELDKAFMDIDNWKKLKGHALTEKEKTLLKLIFDQN